MFMTVDAEKFCKILKSKGMSAKELAEKIEMSPCTISNIINGRNLPSYQFTNGCFFELEMTDHEFMDCFYRQNILSNQ